MKPTSLIFFLAGAVLLSVLAHSRGEAPAAAPEHSLGSTTRATGFPIPTGAKPTRSSSRKSNTSLRMD